MLVQMGSQTMDITHFANIFHNDVCHNQSTVKLNEAQQIAYDTTQNFANLHDLRSLACKIKVLNSDVPGT